MEQKTMTHAGYGDSDGLEGMDGQRAGTGLVPIFSLEILECEIIFSLPARLLDVFSKIRRRLRRSHSG
jgi:hypothetical protein